MQAHIINSRPQVHTLPMIVDPIAGRSEVPCWGQCGVPECLEVFTTLPALRKHIKQVSVAAIKYYLPETRERDPIVSYCFCGNLLVTMW